LRSAIALEDDALAGPRAMAVTYRRNRSLIRERSGSNISAIIVSPCYSRATDTRAAYAHRVAGR
jgi:hypothetical protein